MKNFDEILYETEYLPLEQRLSLAHRLLVSSEPTTTPAVQKAWDLVIRERISRYDPGQAQSRSASEVFSELDNRLGT